MNQVEVQVVSYVLTFAITTLAGFLCTTLYHWIGVHKLQKMQVLAKVAVQWAQHNFKGFETIVIEQHAAEKLVQLLSVTKVKISQDNALTFVHAAVTAFENEVSNSVKTLDAPVVVASTPVVVSTPQV